MTCQTTACWSNETHQTHIPRCHLPAIFQVTSCILRISLFLYVTQCLVVLSCSIDLLWPDVCLAWMLISHDAVSATANIVIGIKSDYPAAAFLEHPHRLTTWQLLSSSVKVYIDFIVPAICSIIFGFKEKGILKLINISNNQVYYYRAKSPGWRSMAWSFRSP